MSETYYVQRQPASNILQLDMQPSEIRKILIDWNAYLGQSGSTLSSVTVTAEQGDNVTIGTVTNDAGVTSVLITAGQYGPGRITATLTTSAGEVVKLRIMVRIRDYFRWRSAYRDYGYCC